MTCVDSIAQYEQSLSKGPGTGWTIGTFSLIQHWSNGQAGHGSGWLQYIGNPIQSDPEVTVFVGHTNVSYDPYGRNPTLVYVAGNGLLAQAGVGLGYQGGQQPIGTDLVNVECSSMGGTLVLIGTESVHAGPTDAPLASYDLISLQSMNIWGLKSLKGLLPALAGAVA